jgi:hypothetical protein
MKSRYTTLAALGLLAVAGSACTHPSLKEAFRDRFLVGAALNESQFTESLDFCSTLNPSPPGDFKKQLAIGLCVNILTVYC